PAASQPSSPSAPPDNRGSVAERWGLEITNISDDLRRLYKVVDSVKGVLVTNVEAGSVAAEKKLKAGHVIVEMNQEVITTPAAWQKVMDDAKNAGRKGVLLLVADAEGELRFVAFPVNPKELAAEPPPASQPTAPSAASQADEDQRVAKTSGLS